ncbi:hypothetical protein GMRT_13113 [Giardia muris]|uniref:Uncharacterized protein n=1 Tax=Giardia muris TaxID=5742 RepID=A0A4Z1SXM6_GIAMU|nr:hypothetical protein GMRT_13113 [Giardia muris]|eukprot:TNJ30522.1 hypothetical protein GMRT_13113 [Giardia muris]
MRFPSVSEVLVGVIGPSQQVHTLFPGKGDCLGHWLVSAVREEAVYRAHYLTYTEEHLRAYARLRFDSAMVYILFYTEGISRTLGALTPKPAVIICTSIEEETLRASEEYHAYTNGESIKVLFARQEALAKDPVGLIIDFATSSGVTFPTHPFHG